MKFKNLIATFLLITSLALAGGVLWYSLDKRKSSPVEGEVIRNSITKKCPSDYTTDEERIAAVDSWTNEFYDTYPDATLTDWSDARHQFYVANNCTEELKRYENFEKEK